MLTRLFAQASVAFVSAGVILSTLARPSAPASDASLAAPATYALGVSMLVVSLLLSGVLGMLQEQTYATYGPCWREGIFYTVRALFLLI